MQHNRRAEEPHQGLRVLQSIQCKELESPRQAGMHRIGAVPRQGKAGTAPLRIKVASLAWHLSPALFAIPFSGDPLALPTNRNKRGQGQCRSQNMSKKRLASNSARRQHEPCQGDCSKHLCMHHTKSSKELRQSRSLRCQAVTAAPNKQHRLQHQQCELPHHATTGRMSHRLPLEKTSYILKQVKTSHFAE